MITTHEGFKYFFLKYWTGFYGKAQAAQAAFALTKYTFYKRRKIFQKVRTGIKHRTLIFL